MPPCPAWHPRPRTGRGAGRGCAGRGGRQERRWAHARLRLAALPLGRHLFRRPGASGPSVLPPAPCQPCSQRLPLEPCRRGPGIQPECNHWPLTPGPASRPALYLLLAPAPSCSHPFLPGPGRRLPLRHRAPGGGRGHPLCHPGAHGHFHRCPGGRAGGPGGLHLAAKGGGLGALGAGAPHSHSGGSRARQGGA